MDPTRPIKEMSRVPGRLQDAVTGDSDEVESGEIDAADALVDGEPDVLLDVPRLEVEELNLKVQNLEAHVALEARLAGLLELSVGAHVTIDDVDLELKGVHAEALLKVRLDTVLAILERTLATVDRNPDLLRDVSRVPAGVAAEVADASAGALTEAPLAASGDKTALQAGAASVDNRGRDGSAQADARDAASPPDRGRRSQKRQGGASGSGRKKGAGKSGS